MRTRLKTNLRNRLASVTVVTALVLSACSGSSSDSTVEAESSTSTAPVVVEATTTTTAASTPPTTTTTMAEVTTSSDDTSLENPLAVGAVTRTGDWSLRISSVTADATDLIMDFNDFNDPPANGEQFFMATLEATYVGDESSTFWTDMTLKAVGDSKVAYETFDAWCGSIPDPIDEAGETFPGGTITGNTCWMVSSEDAASLVMLAELSFSFGDERVFLSLDSTAEPLGESTAAADLGGFDSSGAAAVGAVASVGDWSLRVTEVTANATDLIMDYNDFNDPPTDGEQFFMATLEATFVGDESSTFWTDLNLKTVGESNVAYESFDAYCGSIPDPIDSAGETFPGGTITGNMCWKVSSDDADNLTMIGEEGFSFDGGRTLFSLDPNATPLDESTEFDGSGIGDLPTAALGEAVRIGDWTVLVVDVNANATELINSENPFNEPPDDDEQFFMVTLEATYEGDDSGSFWADMSMATVGDSSVAYESYDSFCGSIPDAIDDEGETFSGGTITGNSCWKISSEDADSLILIVEEFFSFDEDRAFFALR